MIYDDLPIKHDEKTHSYVKWPEGNSTNKNWAPGRWWIFSGKFIVISRAGYPTKLWRYKTNQIMGFFMWQTCEIMGDEQQQPNMCDMDWVACWWIIHMDLPYAFWAPQIPRLVNQLAKCIWSETKQPQHGYFVAERLRPPFKPCYCLVAQNSCLCISTPIRVD